MLSTTTAATRRCKAELIKFFNNLVLAAQLTEHHSEISPFFADPARTTMMEDGKKSTMKIGENSLLFFHHRAVNENR